MHTTRPSRIGCIPAPSLYLRIQVKEKPHEAASVVTEMGAHALAPKASAQKRHLHFCSQSSG